MAQRVIAITQARIGSSRLSGKVLLPILGRPLLWWHLTRLQRAAALDGIVVATTEEPGAEAIVEIADSLGIPAWRGSVDDVLGRYHGAAAMAGASTIVRVTSDCPLIDPALIDALIRAYQAQGDIDYLSLDVAQLPRGLDAEIFSSALLALADREAQDPAEREHVTAFFYRRPERFRIDSIAPHTITRPGLRLCVDTAGDFDLVTRVIEALAPSCPEFGWRDIAQLLDRHPDWAAINAGVVQKAV